MATAIHNYTAIIENGDVDKIPSRLFLNNDKVSQLEDKKLDTAGLQESRSQLKSWTSSDLIHYINEDVDLHRNTSVLLLYTASFCGYCAMAVTHFVALSTFIAEHYGANTLKVTLAKIDMFKNSLPPDLSPMRLPTVVFLPSWK